MRIKSSVIVVNEGLDGSCVFIGGFTGVKSSIIVVDELDASCVFVRGFNFSKELEPTSVEFSKNAFSGTP